MFLFYVRKVKVSFLKMGFFILNYSKKVDFQPNFTLSSFKIYMSVPPTIYFTVTNDLSFDQRMFRICSSLKTAGYNIHLIGRQLTTSPPLKERTYRQTRLKCFFNGGPLFYLEFNLRLFFFLLFRKMDGVVAIDLDTILPVLFVSKLKGTIRLYDAHELFCEMKEVVERPLIHRIWSMVERYAVPKFIHGYAVNQHLTDYFKGKYNLNYQVVRNMSLFQPANDPVKREGFILYQGAVNEGRCFETLIPAMKDVQGKLVICGTGNYLDQTKALVSLHGLSDKVIFKGNVDPNELRMISSSASIGITLFEKESKNNYYSLANRFFDYVHAGTPQICVNYPAYATLNQIHCVAVLLNDVSVISISDALNRLLEDDQLWNMHHQACLKAAPEWSWQIESEVLVSLYKNIFG